MIRMPERPLCRRHMLVLVPPEEPNGVTWQARYTIAMVKIAQLMLEDPRIQRQTHGQVDEASAIIAQHVPLCCYLGDGRLRFVHEEIASKIAVIVAGRSAGHG